MPGHTRLRLLRVMLGGVMLLAIPTLHAQQAGHVDPSFGASLGLAGNVEHVLVEPDGKILVTGSFGKSIVRLNADGSLDAGFDPGSEMDGIVNASAVQMDGKVIVAGGFNVVGGVTRKGIARLNADGSVDASFDPGVGLDGFRVNAITVQTDGKVVTGGSFAGVGGVARHLVARLNANGSLDTGFDPGAGVSGSEVFALAVQADGKVVIGGDLTDGGANRIGVARLNADGSRDTGFAPVAGVGVFSVLTLAVQADGKVVIGGNFISFGEAGRNYIARLNADGTVDAGFDPGAATLGFTVGAVALQPDGKVVIGGDFTSVGGVARSHIARLNADGSVDAGFDPGSGVDGYSVYTLAVQKDGKVVIGGSFTAVDGAVANGVARLNANGSVDGTFQADVAAGPNLPVEAVAVQSDGKVIIGGDFTSVSGVARSHIARLNTDGSLDVGFNPGAGTNGLSVEAVAVQSDGKVIIGGDFTSVGGVDRAFLARLNANGSVDTGFDPGFVAGRVHAIAVQANGKVVIGGDFDSVGGAVRNGVARLNNDGSVDTGFDPVAVEDPVVSAVAVQLDGKVVIGGGFEFVSGISRPYLARLDSDGSLDMSFDPGVINGSVYTLAVQSDDTVVIGGVFGSVGGVHHRSFARLNANGSVDTGFNHGTGVDSYLSAVIVQKDGKVVLGGSFTQVDGVDRHRVARLNADGSVDAGFDPGAGPNDSVSALAVQADGKVVIGGRFNGVSGNVRNYVARLNGNGSPDPTFVPGAGVPNIASLARQADDDRVIVGGSFSDVSGVPINALARLNTDGSLDSVFAPGLGSGNTVDAVALQPDDGDVLAADVPAASAASSPILPSSLGSRWPKAQTKIKNPIIRCGKLTGAVDATFQAVTDGRTFAIVGLSGRLALIGGSFSNVNNVPHPGLARLQADGSLDASFVGVTNGSVRGLSVAGVNGTLIAGGDFTTVDGVARSHVARLFANGSVDASFDPGMGPNGAVNAVRALANGQVLIGGSFTSVDGVPRDGVARLNSDGSLDASYPVGAASAVRAAVKMTAADAAAVTVKSFDLQGDGKVVIGGSFSQIGGLTRPNVARLNADGSVDPSFDPGTGTNAAVNALQLQPDGRTLLGGGFSSVDGLERRGAARLLGDSDIQTQVPQITSTVAVGGRAGQMFVYQITATNNPTSFAVSGMLPAGLSVDGGTGLISGTPMVAGTFMVNVSASNTVATGSAALTLTIIAPVPVVTVMAGDGLAIEGIKRGKVFFMRTGDTATDLTVLYKVKGTAEVGRDYEPLSGSVTIPAGSSWTKIKVRPLENDVHDGTTKAKVKLLLASDGSYTVGDPFLARIKIIDDD